MPLTKAGKEAKAAFEKEYGAKGEGYFFASENKGIPGSEKWTHKSAQKAAAHRALGRRKKHAR
jgi:hypothetical protein